MPSYTLKFMFLDEKQARARLDSPSNLANRFGNGVGNSSVPEVPSEESTPSCQEGAGEHSSETCSSEGIETRNIPLPGKNRINLKKEERTEIATRARAGERANVLAEEFRVTPLTISNIKTGKTAGIDEKKVSETLNTIRDKALDRLMMSMGLLTDDKLSGCSARDLSIIASNMGKVVEKTIPKSDSPDKVQLIIYSPEMKQERAFDIVEINV